MNLITLQKKYNTQAKCIRYLEKVRWGGTPVCPHCQAENITPRRKIPGYVPKFHCNSCNRDFTVLNGTIFEASKLALPAWFSLITLMLAAPKGISAMQLSRNLGITYKTAWYSAMRVRCAMIDDEVDLLEGIVEMDESYLGGKPRKRNRKKGFTDDNTASLSEVETEQPKNKRGRGTKKVPVVGIVEREGKERVRLEVMEKITSKNLLAMLKRYVNTEKAIAMTDELPAYHKFEEILQHLVIKHKEAFSDGIINTNRIENVWSIVKAGLKGQYNALSKKYLPFYLAEWSYKYNRRNDRPAAFEETIEHAVTEEKPMLDYKPTKSVEEITVGNAVRKAADRQEGDKRRKREERIVQSKLRKIAGGKKKHKPARVMAKKATSKKLGKIAAWRKPTAPAKKKQLAKASRNVSGKKKRRIAAVKKQVKKKTANPRRRK